MAGNSKPNDEETTLLARLEEFRTNIEAECMRRFGTKFTDEAYTRVVGAVMALQGLPSRARIQEAIKSALEVYSGELARKLSD